MITAGNIHHDNLGHLARKVRISLRLTQTEIAERIGTTREEVYFFENNFPVCLDIRRKILKELWSLKTAASSN